MSNKTKAVLMIVLAALFGGANSTVIKLGLGEVPKLSYAFLRFAIAAIVLVPIFLAKGDGRAARVKLIWSLAPVSLLATANIVLFLYGVARTTATIAQLLYAGVPLLIGVIAFAFYGERLSLRKIAGIVIGFLGVGAVVILPMLERGVPFAGDLMGNLIISVSVVIFAFYIVFSKRAQTFATPLALTTVFVTTTAIVLLPLSIFDLAAHPQWWQSVGWIGWGSILYTALISTILVYLLQQLGIKYGGALVASLAFYLWPIFSYLVAAAVLHERLTTWLVAGGALALIGIYLVTKPAARSVA